MGGLLAQAEALLAEHAGDALHGQRQAEAQAQQLGHQRGVVAGVEEGRRRRGALVYGAVLAVYVDAVDDLAHPSPLVNVADGLADAHLAGGEPVEPRVVRIHVDILLLDLGMRAPAGAVVAAGLPGGGARPLQDLAHLGGERGRRLPLRPLPDDGRQSPGDGFQPPGLGLLALKGGAQGGHLGGERGHLRGERGVLPAGLLELPGERVELRHEHVYDLVLCHFRCQR